MAGDICTFGARIAAARRGAGWSSGFAVLVIACGGGGEQAPAGSLDVVSARAEPSVAVPVAERVGLSASARGLESTLPALGACVQYPADIERTFGILGPDLEFSGGVVSSGSGIAPFGEGACPLVGGGDRRAFGAGSALKDDIPALAQSSWLRLQQANDLEVVLLVVASGFAFPSDLELVRSKLHTERDGTGPERSWLEVRDRDELLILWLGLAGSVEELQAPREVSLRQGLLQSTRSAECASSWDEPQLRVAADGIELNIAPRARAMVGSWQVTNGGVDLSTGISRCAEGFVATARAAVWPRRSAVPIGGGIGGPCDPGWFVPGSTADANLVCQRDSRFPEGYLTLACDGDAGCPAESRCDDAFCRLP